MNNKKGFTLIELLAVITLIAIIAVIAVPNVVKMIDNSKREEFVSDAKNMISKAKYMYKLDKYKTLFIDENGCKSIALKNLDIDITTDPDSNNYDQEASKVKVCVESNLYVYYVTTMSKKDGFNTRGIYNGVSNPYVKDVDLSRSSVVQYEDN